jgi:hypothetical protein
MLRHDLSRKIHKTHFPAEAEHHKTDAALKIRFVYWRLFFSKIQKPAALHPPKKKKSQKFLLSGNIPKSQASEKYP